MNTVLLIAACTCLIGAFAWEIGKAVTSPMRASRRRRIDTRPGFPVIIAEKNEPRTK